jgi:hypothetical protein
MTVVEIQNLEQFNRTENTQNENRFPLWCEMDYTAQIEWAND